MLCLNIYFCRRCLNCVRTYYIWMWAHSIPFPKETFFSQSPVRRLVYLTIWLIWYTYVYSTYLCTPYIATTDRCLRTRDKHLYASGEWGKLYYSNNILVSWSRILHTNTHIHTYSHNCSIRTVTHLFMRAARDYVPANPAPPIIYMWMTARAYAAAMRKVLPECKRFSFFSFLFQLGFYPHSSVGFLFATLFEHKPANVHACTFVVIKPLAVSQHSRAMA